MSSLFRPDPIARSTWRWGGAIAALLVVQSLFVAALFWWLAQRAHIRDAEAEFRADCRSLAAMPPAHRVQEIEEALARDLHRKRFLALFDGAGRLIDGNVAALPSGAPAAGSAIVSLTPTRLPGKQQDIARLVICPMPDGERLLTAVDLDDVDRANQIVERALLVALLPAVLIALGFGLLAGRRAAGQVDAIRRLAARIVAGDLDERLPVGSRPDSFGQLCAHINAMLDRLQQLIGEVRGVGDDIAHQMRTPLTRLRARLERGLRDAEDPVSFRSVADAALAEVDTLLAIVAALLRIRELNDDERRSRFGPVDLSQLVEDAYDLYRPSAEDRGIDLVCDVDSSMPAIVEGDADLLIEAVSNLIDNAMKFGPVDGRVVLSLRQAGAAPVISVCDQGYGVPSEERPLVIQRFYRARHDCAGAGLGLSLVQAIADLHGFALKFEDKPSTVSIVCLPRQV
jgi:signal transduction histidine kinase